jgi:glyoxylase-like metal-dependent hydrolase (beta-lactamase superfamily II)
MRWRKGTLFAHGVRTGRATAAKGQRMPEVIAGLYQLKVPIPNNPIGYVLPYLIEMPGGYTLIDPGWNADESVQSLRNQLGELGIGFKDLKRVIATHIHPDHYGMAGRIREESGCEVLLHEREVGFIQSRYTNPGPLLNQMGDWLAMHGIPNEERHELQYSSMPARRFVQETQPDHTLADGECLRIGKLEFRVIWTPGHTPGHICFHEEKQELILTGDHILPTISPNVSLHPQSDADPLGDYLRSMKKLRGLKTKKVLPAHEYSFDDLEARLDELEHHHELRLQEMIDAIKGGSHTAYEIARFVTWATGKFDDFNPWMRRSAVGETLSHLRYLANENRVTTWEEDGVVKWGLA